MDFKFNLYARCGCLKLHMPLWPVLLSSFFLMCFFHSSVCCCWNDWINSFNLFKTNLREIFSHLQVGADRIECAQLEEVSWINRINYRKSKNDRECKPRIDSGMERNELWYMSNVSRNGNPVTSSGSSHKRFRDKSAINGGRKETVNSSR